MLPKILTKEVNPKMFFHRYSAKSRVELDVFINIPLTARHSPEGDVDNQLVIPASHAGMTRKS